MSVAAILQIDETLHGLLLKIWEEGDGSDVQIPVTIEVGGTRVVSTLHPIEPRLFEMIRAIIQVNTKAVIRLVRCRIVAVVTVGSEDVGKAIAIEIHELKSRVTKSRRLFDDRLQPKLATALIVKNV